MRTAAKAIATGLGLIIQVVFVIWLAGGWAAHATVAGGECGWDGSCVDDTTFPLVIGSVWAVLALEIVVAVLVSLAAYRRERESGGPTGLAQLAGRRLPVVILVGVAWELVLVIQNAVIARRTETSQSPATWTADARSYLCTSVIAVAVDVALAGVVWLCLIRPAARGRSSSRWRTRSRARSRSR